MAALLQVQPQIQGGHSSSQQDRAARNSSQATTHRCIFTCNSQQMLLMSLKGTPFVLFCFHSVWTTETVCKVLKANIKDKAFCPNREGSEDEEVFPYPCLQVWVNLTASGQEVMLYQTEDTLERNPKVLATQIAYSFSATI